MKPVRAQYLLRFDDLCPTMDRVRWSRFEALVARHRLQPILAVVPENRDPALVRGEADPRFWERMRELERAGAMIGLHGYQHVCATQGRSLIPMHLSTEFAGVPYELQRDWIRAGLRILRGNGLNPKIWVAPRHGFDTTTLRVLREERLEMISDGFAEKPFQAYGLTWIPQQLWGPVEKRRGLWTICLHGNSVLEEEIDELEAFLRRWGEQFTSVERVMAEWLVKRRSMGDWSFHMWMLLRIRIARLRRA